MIGLSWVVAAGIYVPLIFSGWPAVRATPTAT